MTLTGATDTPRLRVALVLGAKLLPDGRPSRALRRRADHAAQLWHAGRVDRIVVSGGMAQAGKTEAEAMADLLQGTGVPDHAITREDHARNTWQNIALSQPLIPEGAEVVLVTDRYHAPRARLIARRQGIIAHTDGPSDHGVALRLRIKNRLREAAALLYFLLFGPRD